MKMRTINRNLCVALIGTAGFLATFPVLSAATPSQDSRATTKQTAEKDSKAAQTSEGERKFKQNCSRCHKAPQNFSPRISGTILRHMRVRASLSQQDEREILQFLNP
jgi:cytochrome c5